MARSRNARDLLARAFVGVGRARGQRVRGAVDVGVLVLVEVREAIDHRLRLLRRRGVVEPDERPPVDPFLQDREVAAHGLHVAARVDAGSAAPGISASPDRTAEPTGASVGETPGTRTARAAPRSGSPPASGRSSRLARGRRAAAVRRSSVREMPNGTCDDDASRRGRGAPVAAPRRTGAARGAGGQRGDASVSHRPEVREEAEARRRTAARRRCRRCRAPMVQPVARLAGGCRAGSGAA